MSELDDIQLCNISIKNVFKEFLIPFKYLKGDCIKKDCIDPNVYNEFKKVADYYNVKYDDDDDLVKQLAKKMDCTHHTISCLLEKILNESDDNFNVNKSLLETQINNVKPPGPFDSKEWFSNINIDSVLEQFEELFKDKNFLHIYFHMRDFKNTNNDPEQKKNLNKIKFSECYKKGVRCFGVVFNTDYSTGNGEHWFALFGDFSKKPFTIEHFNSSGDGPLPEVCELMCNIKHDMMQYLFNYNIESKSENDCNKYSDGDDANELICNKKYKTNKVKCMNVTTIINQKDNHSCGSYSLFYILCRLCGISYKVFEKKEIGDKLMHEFRRNIFSHNY